MSSAAAHSFWLLGRCGRIPRVGSRAMTMPRACRSMYRFSNDELRADSGNQTHQCVKCTECACIESTREAASRSLAQQPLTPFAPLDAVWQLLDVEEAITAHLPICGRWQSGDAVAFGGSGSAWKNRTTHMNAHAGLNCYSTTIGTTDGWKLVTPKAAALVPEFDHGVLSSYPDSQVFHWSSRCG